MFMPKVSVIVPIYKVENYIAKCAKSLLEQSLNDMEFIFINDCSPDSSMVVLKNLIQEYPERKAQIKIIEFSENHGVAYARRRGIEASEGEYIIFCDSDDWVDPKMYHKMYYCAKSRSLDVVLCNFYFVNNGENKYPFQMNKYNDINDLLKDSISGVASLSLCNRLVKKDIYKNYDIIYPALHMLEDSVLCVQIAYYAKTVSYIDHPLYFYRINETSISNRIDNKSCVDRWSQALTNNRLIFNFLNNKGITLKYKKEIENRKYLTRRFLLPIINYKNQLTNWRSTFPEINCTILFNPYMCCIDKIKYILLNLRVYPYVSKLRDRYSQIIYL